MATSNEGQITGPDWRQVEERLYVESEAAILRFAADHSDEECSFFAYEAEADSGLFFLCFDAPSNSTKSAKEHERIVRQQREKMLTLDWSWQEASYYLELPRVVDHSPSVGDFAYPQFVVVEFSGWQEFADSDDYPMGNRGPQPDDYLEGNVRIVLWRVIERLITAGALERLRLATPCRLGFELHERGLVITRIIHWPDATTPIG